MTKFILSMVFMFASATIATQLIGLETVQAGYGVGKFEQKNAAIRVVDAAIVNSATDRLMAKDQPGDLYRMKAALVKAVLDNKDYHTVVSDIADAELPKKSSERKKLQFSMQLELGMIAAEYGYEELDN